MRIMIDANVLISAALKADVLLTGDKDLLEAGIIHPKILTPTVFLSNDFKL